LRRRTIVQLWMLVSIFGWAGCKEPEPSPPDYEALRRKEPLSESYNVNYLRTEVGKLKVRLKAPHLAERYALAEGNETLTEMNRGIEIEFFDSTGKLESRLTAQRAQLFDKRGYADASGNVIVINEKNERLETEHLRWNRTDNKLTTGSFVKIYRPGEVIFGDSLEANQNFSVYRIFKMKGTVQVNE